MNGGTSVKIGAWVIGAALLVATGQAAAAPIIGIYTSDEFGGDVMDGRWSESLDGGQLGQVGNVLNSASWDGSALGSQWELYGQSLADWSLVSSRQIGGLIQQKFAGSYDGGTLVLTDDGSWWNSTAAGLPGEYENTADSYEFEVKSYDQDVVVTTNNGNVVGYYAHVALTAGWVEDPKYIVSFMLAWVYREGVGSAVPADYPEFLPDGEGPGHWGVLEKIQMNLEYDPTIPEPVTAGLLAAGGALVLLRRRRRAA